MATAVTMSQILRAASLLATDELRIEYLKNIRGQKIYAKTLQDIVQGAYHPGVVWLLPKGEVKYRPASTKADLEAFVYRESRKFYVLCKGGADNITQERRNEIFAQILEAIHPDDAELLVHVKDKVIPYPNLSYSFFLKCFPDWLPADGEAKSTATFSETAKSIELPKPKELVERVWPNKGKGWYNDGVKDYLIFPEEAEAKKYKKGQIK